MNAALNIENGTGPATRSASLNSRAPRFVGGGALHQASNPVGRLFSVSRRTTLAIACFGFWGMTVALEAPLRYGCDLVHIPILFYARDVALVISCLLAFTIVEISRATIVTVLILGLSTAIGICRIGNAVEVLFEVKVLLPFIVGVVGGPLGVMNPVGEAELTASRYRRRLFLISCEIMLAITLSGLLVNYFVAFPWQGMTTDLMGQEISQNKYWASGDVERLAGFCRSSFYAAVILAVSAIGIIVNTRSIWLKLVIWIAAGVGIEITTTKGMLAAWVLLPVLHGTMVQFRYSRLARGIIISALCGLIVLLPLAAYFLDLHPTGAFADAFDSVADRIDNTWPDALGRVWGDAGNVLGLGVGGIGATQEIFSPQSFNAADNLFVFLACSTGVFSFVGISWIGLAIYGLGGSGDWVNRFLFSVGIVSLIYGITTSVLENAPLALCLGLAVGVYEATPTRRCSGVLTSPRNQGRFLGVGARGLRARKALPGVDDAPGATH